MPAKSRSEPWCLLVFLYFSSAITLSVARLAQYAEKRLPEHLKERWQSRSRSESLLVSIAMYLLWSVGLFFVWGYAAMVNLEDSQEFAWKAIALGTPLLTIVA